MSRLFAQVFSDPNYAGQYRWLASSVPSFEAGIGFNDTVTSIKVFRGNEYQPGDKIRFYEHPNYEGGYLDLEPGFYPNIQIQPFSFNDRISSAFFLPTVPGGLPLTVRLRIRLFEHANFLGQSRDVLLSESNLANVGFDNKASSIQIFAGEDYAPNWVCDFFENPGYAGGMLQPGDFGPGTSLANLNVAPISFNDKISSVRIRALA